MIYSSCLLPLQSFNSLSTFCTETSKNLNNSNPHSKIGVISDLDLLLTKSRRGIVENFRVLATSEKNLQNAFEITDLQLVHEPFTLNTEHAPESVDLFGYMFLIAAQNLSREFAFFIEICISCVRFPDI